MSNIAKSPDRNTFQKNNYLKRCEEEGKEPSQAYLDFWENAELKDETKLTDPEWKKNNMEYDLRSTTWIVDKVRKFEDYAQNLYAAMCNNDFIKNNVWPLLKEETWSCSWRYAGGIIADMRGEGDYIDWYCSGIGNDEDGYGLTKIFPATGEDARTYVPEGLVTEEIKEDLLKLGWIVAPNSEEENGFI